MDAGKECSVQVPLVMPAADGQPKFETQYEKMEKCGAQPFKGFCSTVNLSFILRHAQYCDQSTAMDHY